jgi:glyoxylase-like metal-dependent hydrolase (beta-lactamase superfamily II)
MALRLAVPYAVEHVNAYLLAGDPVTLVDAGAQWPRGLPELDAALAPHGLRTEDVELLVLTHHHDDHIGLAELIRQRSGCEVAAHAETATRLVDMEAWRTQENDYEMAMLRLHGAGDDIVQTVPEAWARAREHVASVPVDRVLREDDVLHAGGHELTVQLRPGHSPSDTLLVSEHGWAVLGDHLLASAPSGVLAHRPLDGGDPADRPRVMLTYRDGLRRTADLGLARGLPGHGPTIEDPARLVGERLAEQDRGAQRVLERMPAGPVSAWALCGRAWPNRSLDSADHPVAMPFIVLSDLLALLDLLADRGLVRELHAGSQVRYERA